MLESSFIHCSGIGPKTERSLWHVGILDWSTYLLGESQSSILRSRRAALDTLIADSVERLRHYDYRWFARMLPSREQWRAYPAFGDRAAYLDIETTGGPDGGLVTVIGVYDGRNLRQYIRGVDLHQFPAEITQYATLVTYFGSGFDLPVLKREFGMDFPQIHIDLCFLLKRLGYSGGLKSVETQLGLRRSAVTGGLSGFDAVRLWWSWRGGNAKALDILLAYNAEDVINLERLLRIAYPIARTTVLGNLRLEFDRRGIATSQFDKPVEIRVPEEDPNGNSWPESLQV